MPGPAAVLPRPGSRRRHCGPRLQRRHWSVRAQRQRSPRSQQRPQRERPVRAAGPVGIGRITVIQGVGGLDARRQAQFAEAGEVLAADKLGMLNPPGDPGRRERIQRHLVGGVADRMHRRDEARLPGPDQQVQQLRLAHSEQPAAAVRIRVHAVRRAGVQRAVDQHLERTHPQQPRPAGHVQTGPHPRRDGPVQVLRIDPGVHPEGSRNRRPRGAATRPGSTSFRSRQSPRSRVRPPPARTPAPRRPPRRPAVCPAHGSMRRPAPRAAARRRPPPRRSVRPPRC